MDSKIQRLRTERSPTPATPRTASAAQPSPPKTGRGIMDIRIGEPAVFAGDEKSWGDRRFKLRSYVSVVESTPRQHDGRSRAGSPRERVATLHTSESRHGRAAQVSVRHADQWACTSDHPTTGVRFTSSPRPCSQIQWSRKVLPVFTYRLPVRNFN